LPFSQLPSFQGRCTLLILGDDRNPVMWLISTSTRPLRLRQVSRDRRTLPRRKLSVVPGIRVKRSMETFPFSVNGAPPEFNHVFC
jgi:hypothetical protein